MPRLTILFIALDGFGHFNACISVAQKLVRRGHRVVFAMERAWRGTASKYAGIEEVEVIDPTRDPNFEANEYWIRFMAKWRAKWPLEPLEALKVQDMDLEWQFQQTMLNIDHELARVIAEVKPNVMVVDTYTVIPCVYHSKIPWVWLTSATPLVCLPSEHLPPTQTGYSTAGPKSQWDEYRKLRKEVYGDIFTCFCARLESLKVPPPTHGMMIPSPYLNIYAYPEAIDYLAIRPLPPKWLRFDHFIREDNPKVIFEIPAKLFEKPMGQLIYVSMGSMGCADVNLMKRIIGILAKSPNRFIFSLGPFGEQFELAPNQWGSKFVPQTKVIQTVDLVITHGGNNTFLESLYYGKPMIVTPLWGDQRDNAQRITELELGARLSPYHATESEFLDTIERLLYDQQLKTKLGEISLQMQQSNATEKAAIEIEKLVIN